MDRSTAPSALRRLAAVAVGVILGVVVLSLLRTAYYIARGLEPQMSPTMFVIFSPLVAAWFMVPVLLIESILSRFWWRPDRYMHCLLIGASYATILLGLLETWMLVFVLVLNPIVLRIAFRDEAIERLPS